ncbi:MAG: hypothetical protein EOP05_02055 [Proteobacteria bacterium]|nr:MAG: hypothetical protein EOP05_02055 [Pseudomonadota bacterium]
MRATLLSLSVTLLACAAHAQMPMNAFYQRTTNIQFLAGKVSSAGALDAAGSAARFRGPMGIAKGPSGELYVADQDNHTIRKITAGGVVSTLAGSARAVGSTDGIGAAARFNMPSSVAVDGTGNVFVADSNNFVIRKITPAGVVATFAGTAGEIGSDDGIGSAARFFIPIALAFNSAGELFVADSGNHNIRKITASGVVTTLAGGSGLGSTDGEGLVAQFANPRGIMVALSGDIYVSDTSNKTIRKITAAGMVSTFAGTAQSDGTADGLGAAARFTYPTGIATDSSGNIFVSDSNPIGLNHTIRKITPGGAVSTFAGTAGTSGTTNATGAAARFSGPSGLVVGSANQLFVADYNNDVIRVITPTAAVTNFAGSSYEPGAANGNGSAAGFNSPLALTLDASGTVFVADTYNHTIRKITSSGVVTTIAGVAGSVGNTNGAGTAAKFRSPSGIAVDSAGNLFVADTANHAIRKITPLGVVSTFAGVAGTGSGSYGSADGSPTTARFYSPRGLTIDAAGNLYVADLGNYAVRKITAAGVVSTLAGKAGNPGTADGTGANARFQELNSIARDSSGNIFVSDIAENTVRKITPSGEVTTFAGTAGSTGTADGTGVNARFNKPRGVAVDSGDNLYVVDSSNYTVRKITPAGIVTTIAGTAGTFTDLLGPLPSTLSAIGGLSIANGYLYVVENNGIIYFKIP